MFSKASIAIIFTVLLVDAEVLAQMAEESTLQAGVPMGAVAPEREGCDLSGSMEFKDNTQGMGMGFHDNPAVQNIGECWTQGLRVLKKQLSTCQAPNEFVVRMQFKRGPRLLRDERRGVCHGENRNIASQPESVARPIPSRKPMKHRGKKRWHPVGESFPNEAQPLNPPEQSTDPLPAAEGL